MSNYEAVKRHRLRRKLQTQRYRVMLNVIDMYLYALSWRKPTSQDVLDLLEKLCVAGGAEDLLQRVRMLKSNPNRKSPAGEAGVEERRE